jgi:hypothetical protein
MYNAILLDLDSVAPVPCRGIIVSGRVIDDDIIPQLFE